MSNPYQYGGAPPPPPTPGSDPNRQQYPYSPGIPPQTQPGMPGYQQQPPPTPGAPYGGYADAGFQQQAQGGPYSPSGPPQSPGYQNPQDGGFQGLTAQMGQMGINEGYGVPQPAPARHGRKKQRAFHTLDQAPEASAPPPTTPGFQSPAQQQFPNQFQNQFPGQAPPPTPGAPNPNQFPVPANPQFQPANPPASIAEYNANMRGPSGTGRVDPELIPSIPVSREAAAVQYKTTVYPTMELHHPPPALTDFVAFDQGNSSPKFCRLSLNTIPSSEELLKSTALPLSLIIQPLAPQKEQELPVPVLDFGDEGPPRCRRCRTYINPFMTFSQNGAKFVCNMCLFPNEVPASYYSPLDMTGKRVDREQRPELMRGTVEYIVPKDYWAKEPTPLRWLFAIDVSMEAINKGLIESMVKAIRQSLYGEDEEPLAEGEEATPKTSKRLPQGCKVGILTYDKEVHFYNLNPNLDQAQMLVMTDLEDPFVPLSEGLFVDPYESESVIKGLLDSLPNLFALVKNPEPALFPTLQAAFNALEATGGKIICSLATLPTWGPGRLHFREDSKLFGTDKEKTFFTTEHQEWKKLAAKMVEAGIGADFFLTPAAYIDVATVGHIAEITGGEVFYYPNFIYQRDSPKLEEELAHSMHRETGYQALMKVRCSNGLQVSSYHGNFLHRNAAADLEFGVIDQDKSVSIGFSYDGKLDTKLDAHFQSALLYTTASGERRVRCHNIVAAVTDVAKEGLRFVDQDAVVCTIAKEAAATMAEKSLKQIRGLLTEKCVDILAAYRKNFSGSNPPGQLVLPEALKEFGLYMLCLIKLRAFRGGNVASDMRVHAMRLLKSMSPAELSLFLYPRIIPIHNLEPEDGFADESGHLKVPAAIRASFSRIEEGGVYLVDNGQMCILWLHAQTSPALLTDLFGEGIDNLQAINPYLSELPVLETLLNAQVRNLLQFFKTQRGSKALRIQLARQGLDGAEYEFAGLLMEDRNNEAQSYVDWLVHVHKHIQLEITGQRKKESTDDGISGANLAGLRPPYW